MHYDRQLHGLEGMDIFLVEPIYRPLKFGIPAVAMSEVTPAYARLTRFGMQLVEYNQYVVDKDESCSELFNDLMGLFISRALEVKNGVFDTVKSGISQGLGK